MGSQSDFPPPILRLNGERVERPENAPFRISANTSILVDVSDAVGQFKENKETVEQQTAALQQVRNHTQELAQQIQSLQSSGATTAPSAIINLQNSLHSIDRTLALP